MFICGIVYITIAFASIFVFRVFSSILPKNITRVKRFQKFYYTVKGLLNKDFGHVWLLSELSSAC